MKKLRLLLLFLSITCSGWVQAQMDAPFSQYFMSMGYYNPGFAGTSEDLNIFATHKQQWVGIDGAPKSSFAMADMPLMMGQTTQGVGVVFASESMGASQFTNIGGQYAYKKKLFGGMLSIGAQLGMISQTVHGERLIPPDDEGGDTGSGQASQPDPAIPTTTVEGMAVDMNFGAYFSGKNYYVGVGVMHAMAPEINLGETATSYIDRILNLTAGYNIQTKNPLYQLQPSVFVMTDMMNVNVDLTARLVYNKMFNGGITWRVGNSVIALLGVSLGRFQVGYAYDFPTNAINKASSGSHELMVKYSLKLKKTKTGKNRHKSVRIL